MSDEPGAVGEQQRELLSRLRAVVNAKDAENAVLRQELDAERELRRRLELRIAELERRLGMDSSDSGTPSSKERIGAKEARRARRRQESERERRKDRSRGGRAARAPGQGPAAGPGPGPAEGRGAAGAVPPLQGGPGGRGGGGAGLGAGLGRGSRQDGDRVGAARRDVPVLRDGHDRGSAAGRARGLGVVRAGAERGGGAAADFLRERAAGAGRARDGHAAGCPGLGRVGGQGLLPAVRAAGEGRVR
jgi:hypothetical protein